MIIKNLRWLVLLPLPPLAVFMTQCILNRFFKGRNPQAIAMLAMILGAPLFALFLRFPQFAPKTTTTIWFWAYMALFYASGAYAYFHVFNMSETSRRIRLLFVVAKGRPTLSSDGPFDASAMFQARLSRLEAIGQIRKEGRIYLLNSQLLSTIAKAMRGLSRLLGNPWP